MKKKVKKSNKKRFLTKGERKYTLKKKKKNQRRKPMQNQNKILFGVQNKPYYVQDDFVLYQNDCLEILKQIPENSVDIDRKSTRLNSSHIPLSRMPSSA